MEKVVKKRWFLGIGITLIFISVYGLIRQLPNQTCGFMHYEVIYTTAEGLEFCETGAESFLDLEALPFPVELKITQNIDLKTAQPCILRFKLEGPGGNTFLAHTLSKSHTQLVHVLLVDESLSDYQHLHPQSMGVNGEWSLTFTPKNSGTYRMYAQFIHAKTKRKLIATTQLANKNQPQSKPYVFEDGNIVQDSRFPGTVTADYPQPEVGIPCEFKFRLETTPPSLLEPLMAAYGHAVIFSPNHTGLAHLHPNPGSIVKNGKANLSFAFQPLFTGPHRLWLQTQVNGQEYFLPFDFFVNN